MNKDTGVARGAALYAARLHSNNTGESTGRPKPLIDTTAKMMAILRDDGQVEQLWAKNS